MQIQIKIHTVYTAPLIDSHLPKIVADGIDGYGRGKRQEADYEPDSAWVLKISGLTWDGGRLDLSRDTKCSGVDGYRKHLIPCAADHKQQSW